MKVVDFPAENWTRVLLPDGFWGPKYDWCVDHKSEFRVVFDQLHFLKIVNIRSKEFTSEYPIYFESEQDAIMFALKFGVVK